MGISDFIESIVQGLRNAGTQTLWTWRQDMGHPDRAVPGHRAARLAGVPEGLEIEVYFYDRLAADGGAYEEWQQGRHTNPPGRGLERLTPTIPAGGFGEEAFVVEERDDGAFVLSFPDLMWSTPKARGAGWVEDRPKIQCFPVDDEGQTGPRQVTRETVGEGEAERLVLPEPGRYVVYIWLRPRTIVLHWSVGGYTPSNRYGRTSYHFLVDDDGQWIPGGWDIAAPPAQWTQIVGQNPNAVDQLPANVETGVDRRTPNLWAASWRRWMNNLHLNTAPDVELHDGLELKPSEWQVFFWPRPGRGRYPVSPSGYFAHARGFNHNSVGVCFTGMVNAPNDPRSASWPLPSPVEVLREAVDAGEVEDEEGEDEATAEPVRVTIQGVGQREGAWQPLQAPDNEGHRSVNTAHWQRIVQSDNEDDELPAGHFDKDLARVVGDDTVAVLAGGGTVPLEELPNTVRFRWEDRAPVPLKAKQVLQGLRRVAQLCKAWDLDPMDPNDLCTHFEVDCVHSNLRRKWDVTWLPGELQVAYRNFLDHNGIEREVSADRPQAWLCEDDDHQYMREDDVPLDNWRSEHWDDADAPVENTDRVGDFLRRLVKGMVVNDEVMHNPDVFEFDDDDGFSNFSWAWEVEDSDDTDDVIFQPYAADLTGEDDEPTPDWA